MKGFVLCVAVVLGIFVSTIAFGQEPASSSQPAPTPVVIDGSTSSTTTATATTSSCGTCCKQQTLVGMSQHAVKHAVARGRCVAKTLWSKRPQLRRCKCC